MSNPKQLRFEVPGGGEVSALLNLPDGARWILALAHGAGAGMRHPFLKSLSTQLENVGIATLRYQFPYMEAGRRVPDRPPVLIATVAAAARTASESAPGLPLLAGGKSMGGRMSSQGAAEGLLKGVKGLVFFGFPLHPPNRPGTSRADHLSKVMQPMLFLEGTRDAFADLKLLRPIVANLGPRATLHLIEDADHSFHVPKRTGKTDGDILTELAEVTASWSDKPERQ